MTRIVPAAVRLVSRLLPGLTAWIAEVIWFRPRSRPIAQAPSGAEPFTIAVHNRQLDGYSLGEGKPAFLLHGWGGARSDMNAIAEAFAAAGHTAVVFDMPGHGADRGSRTDLFLMASAIDATVEVFGTPEVLVAHSFGAAATFTAFPGGGPTRVIFFAPALQSERVLRFFADRVGLSNNASRLFFARMERFAGPFLSSILRGRGTIPGARLIILHDPDDRRTAYEDSVTYADLHPDVKVVAVPDVGHQDILHSPEAIAQAVSFGLASEPEPSGR